MKNLFIITAVVGLMACNSTEEPIIIEDQMDCHPTDSNGVLMDDSVYWSNQAYIDSINQLDSVNDLLNYLETIPSTH